ncbi:MAG: hypothetical protein GKR94_24635 [Gammaproteobacteria bacterium]|nr:hypothetical protein [Gammaproteobacteria bacterium]
MNTLTAGVAPSPSVLLNMLNRLREKFGRRDGAAKTVKAQNIGRLHLSDAIMRDIGIGPQFARPTLDHYRRPF